MLPDLAPALPAAAAAAALVSVPVILFLLLRRRWRQSAARAEEVRRLLRLTAEQDALAEAEAAAAMYPAAPRRDGEAVHVQAAVAEGAGRMLCEVCFSPTTTRCARCKAVRYCSGRCQILHWRQGHKEECHPPVIKQRDQFTSDLEIEVKPPAIPSSESNFSSENFSEDENHVVGPSLETTDTDSTSDSSSVHSLPSFSSDPREIPHDDKSHIFNNANRRESSPQDVSPGRPRTEADVSQKEPESQSKEVFQQNGTVVSPGRPRTEANVSQKEPESQSKEVFQQNGTVGTSISSVISETYRNVDPSEDTGGCQAAAFDSSGAPSPEILDSNDAKIDKGVRLQSDARSTSWIPSKMSSQGTSYKSTFTKANSDCKAAPAVSAQLDCRSNSIDDLKTSARKVVKQLMPSQILKHYPPVFRSNLTGRYKVLFPYDLFIKLYNYKEELHPCGLTNCGNSCYANAVLQCLAFTRPLRAYLLQGLHTKTCPKKDWCFTCELESLLFKAKGGQSPLSPDGILSHIQNIGRNLGRGSEEDAHEFLRYAIEAMQSVCLKEAGAEVLDPLAEETTLLHLMFGGYLISKVKCMRCRVKSERRDRMMDLTVEISGDIGTLEEALARYTATEMLGGENKYKCSRCNSFQQAKKKLNISEAPNILTVVLKRFQFGNFGKLNKAVRFPEFLNLAPYMSGTDDKSPVYRLYAVVVHQDIMNAAFSGHYVCFVSSQKKWYKIDDSKVQQVQLERVLSQNAYMLLYARISPRAPSAARNTVSHELARSRSRCVEPPAVSGSGQDISKTNSHPTIPRSASSITRDSSQGRGSQSPDLLSERFLYQKADSSSDCSSLLSCSDEGSWSTESSRNSTSTNEFSEYLFGESGCFGSSSSPFRFSEDPDGFTYSPLATKHPSESASNAYRRDPSSPRKLANGFRSFSYGDSRLRENKGVCVEDGADTPFLYSDLPSYSRKLTEEGRSREASRYEVPPSLSRRCTGTGRTAQTFCR